MNLVEDHYDAEDGLAGWVPSGSCTLSAHAEELAPDALPPPLATGTDDPDEEAVQRAARKPSGRFVLAAHRRDEKDGVCRAMSRVPKPWVTYRVAGWVRVDAAGSGEGSHAVHVEVRVDDHRRLGGGVVFVEPGKWREIKGSFRVDEDESPRSAMVYVHGPPDGVDLKVMDLQVCAVNQIPRITDLRKKTDRVRKCDVTLKVKDGVSRVAGADIQVTQVKNSFPIGSAINTMGMQNPTYVDFFTKHFDWAVPENELKWTYTEPVQGQVSYADADKLIEFCQRHGKPVRGHCIFWGKEDTVPRWALALDEGQLYAAVEARLQSLVARYAGRFPHYEVNNEMLHGDFFRQRLGDDICAHMFRETVAIDPKPALFVNDYNVECADDPNATPEKYVALVTDLQRRRARVGGIGIQGHVSKERPPVGDIICDALDKLAVTNLPIWVTEVDVNVEDGDVCADDLEIVLREAYAHPAVEGIMLWGFMEGYKWIPNGHLLDKDGNLSKAGSRFLELRKEWMSHELGMVEANGNFQFRGFPGTYTVQLTTAAGESKYQNIDVVKKGDTPLQIDVNF